MSPLEAGLISGVLVSAISFLLFEAGRKAALTNSRLFVARNYRFAGTGWNMGVLATCCGLLVLAVFANLHANNTAPAGGDTTQGAARPVRADVARMDTEIARIESYLASVGRTPLNWEEPALQSPAGGLPDVETMIARLEKRLEDEPGDVEGWRTLGWSYLNTGRPTEAFKAYQRAIAIAPDREDLKEELKSAQKAALGEVEISGEPKTYPHAGKNSPD